MIGKVTWRGVTLDARTAAQMAEVARLTTFYVNPTQGSFRPSTKYSASTHAGGGAVDISVYGLSVAQETELIKALDRVGVVGWIRPAIKGLWVRHCHALSMPAVHWGPGVLHPSAWRQIQACMRGRDGLASNGPDPHKNLRTFTTWEIYQQGGNAMSLTTTQSKQLQSIYTQTHPVRRNGQYINLNQEVADSKTALIRMEPKIDQGLANLAAKIDSIEAAHKSQLDLVKEAAKQGVAEALRELQADVKLTISKEV